MRLTVYDMLGIVCTVQVIVVVALVLATIVVGVVGYFLTHYSIKREAAEYQRMLSPSKVAPSPLAIQDRDSLPTLMPSTEEHQLLVETASSDPELSGVAVLTPVPPPAHDPSTLPSTSAAAAATPSSTAVLLPVMSPSEMDTLSPTTEIKVAPQPGEEPFTNNME